MEPLRLGINVDHVATIRQARRTTYPDPVAAALAAERGGAAGITVHLREDRRHIQEADVRALRERVHSKLNLEMAAADPIVEIACDIRPDDVCLVPERRQELTTEGGLAVAGNERRLRSVVERLRRAGIRVSMFIDPEPAEIDASVAIGAWAIELHTGRYADAGNDHALREELDRLREAARRGSAAGLSVHAGHGLTLDNVGPIAAIPEIVELNIGHSIVARAIFVGIEEATREMLAACRRARGV